MSFSPDFTYRTTLRLDDEERALLDALVARERVFKSQLFRQGLRLLGSGAGLPTVKPVTGRPSLTVRFEASDERILVDLSRERCVPKETVLRAAIRALALEKGIRTPRRKHGSSTAA